MFLKFIFEAAFVLNIAAVLALPEPSISSVALANFRRRAAQKIAANSSITVKITTEKPPTKTTSEKSATTEIPAEVEIETKLPEPNLFSLSRYRDAWQRLRSGRLNGLVLPRHNVALKEFKKNDVALNKLKKKKCNVAPDFVPCVNRTTANARAKECCVNSPDIPSGCYKLCNLDFTLLQAHSAIQSGQCPPRAIPPYLNCVSEFEDLRPCCQAKGIRGACSKLCFPINGLPTSAGEYLPCLGPFKKIMDCYWAGLDPR